MVKSPTLRAAIAAPLAAAMVVLYLPVGAARAALVTTDEVMDKAAAESRRVEISAFLARDDIRGRFVAMGVTSEEAERRVAGMSDAEILQISQRIDDLPAGQASTNSIVLILLLVIILVILI